MGEPHASELSEGELHRETGRGEVDETITTAGNQAASSSRPQRERRPPARLAEYIVQGSGEGDVDGTVYRLSKRRAALKASATRNANKAKEIIRQEGSRTVLRNAKERIHDAFEGSRVVTEELIQLQTGQGYEQAATEEWLEGFRTKVEETLDEIDAYQNTIETRKLPPLPVHSEPLETTSKSQKV